MSNSFLALGLAQLPEFLLQLLNFGLITNAQYDARGLFRNNPEIPSAL